MTQLTRPKQSARDLLSGAKAILYKRLDRVLYATRVQVRQHWCRVVMDRETAKLVAQIEPMSKRVLEISGNKWGRTCAFKEYRSAFFPEFDICRSRLPDSFDLIIAEQVWEHLQDPLAAARHVHQMLADKGYFLVSTPFLLKVHHAPVDCSRWTEAGLANLLTAAGFPANSIVTASWGNRACVKGNMGRWVPYRPLLHSLRNEPEFPVVVWALAQK